MLGNRIRFGRREALGLLVSAVLFLPRLSPAAPGTIGTFAGGVGDESPASIARLHRPSGVVADPAGNLFVADTANHRVRKVDLRGVITTVAGTGAAGYGGDNGLANKAKLNTPTGIALDSAGNLYIADTGNNRVRRVSQGVITTFAGTGPASLSGDKDLAIKARLNHPSGLAIDAQDNLYLADTGNNRIRMVSPAGIITTVAGDGVRGYAGDRDLATVARFNAPSAIATSVATSSSGGTPSAGTGATKDPPGMILYIADTGNNRVRRIDTAGWVTTIAGNGVRGFGGDGGAGTRAALNAPTGVTVDPNGNILIADTGNHRVRRVSGGTITTIAGNGVRGFSGDGAMARSARFAGPVGLAILRNIIVVADSGNNRVRGLIDGGFVATIAGSTSDGATGDGGQAVSARLLTPGAVAAGPGGVVYIADTGNSRVRKVEANGYVRTVAGTGVAGYSGDGRAGRLARIKAPQGVAADRAGNLYIADTMNHRIRKVTPNGIITTFAGTGVPGYGGDGGPARYAKLLVPTALAIDGAGNLYVADSGNNRIRKITSRGTITTVAGNGARGFGGEGRPATAAALNLPFGVAVDVDGTLYIADTFNQRIRMVTTAGLIKTVAGTNASGYLGDGGPATLARLNRPFGIAVDHGTIYIADSSNGRIRFVTPDGTIATIAGTGIVAPTPDGIPAAAATLVRPVAVALYGASVLVADFDDHRIRIIERTPIA